MRTVSSMCNLVFDEFRIALVNEFVDAATHYWECYFFGDDRKRLDYFKLMLSLRRIADADSDSSLSVKLCELTYAVKRDVELRI